MNEHETDQTHFREHQADSAPRGRDPNGKQIRLGLNQEPPSNSRHLQEQIETKRISGRKNWITGGQRKGKNQSKTSRADS